MADAVSVMLLDESSSDVRKPSLGPDKVPLSPRSSRSSRMCVELKRGVDLDI